MDKMPLPQPPRTSTTLCSFLAFFAAVLLMTACSGNKVVIQLNDDQAALLDSIALFTETLESEDQMGQFRGHRVGLEMEGSHGGQALHLQWWQGPQHENELLLPWPDGAARNLISVEEVGGVSFLIKQGNTKSTSPTLSLQWVDNRNHKSAAHLAPEHAERWPIDTTWQEIRIPFSDFRKGRSNTDWSQIEALELRMDEFGDVLVDDIRVVPHEPRKTMRKWLKKNPPIPPNKGKFLLFEEELNCVWGMGDFSPHRNFQVKEKRGRNKSMGLDMEWDFSLDPVSGRPLKFAPNQVGFSWNRWQELGPPTRPESAFIVFKLRNIGVNPGPTAALPIHVGFADADGKISSVVLSQDLIPATGFGKWVECRIPFSTFDWATEEAPEGLGSISYLFFEFSEKGHVYIDDLSVRF